MWLCSSVAGGGSGSVVVVVAMAVAVVVVVGRGVGPRPGAQAPRLARLQKQQARKGGAWTHRWGQAVQSIMTLPHLPERAASKPSAQFSGVTRWVITERI